MLEFLLLLIPVAAASGWISARRSMAKREQKQRQDFSPSYYKGLNYLLNEQPDKAIDLFIKMLQVDSETVETHLALGNLFRRRGEVERAIRIHQNLIARPTLDREQRAQALLELGLDYMRAGLFDRAENLFIELIETKLYNEQALTNLLEIYQQEKDWGHCLEIAEKLGPGRDGVLKMQMAHFYCELAQGEIKDNNHEAAEKYLKRAQAADIKNVRATILLGDMQWHKGEYKAAIKNYKQVEQQDVDYLPEIIPGLIACYHALDKKKELAEYLRLLYKRHRGSIVLLALTDIMIEQEGDDSAIDFALTHLTDYPDLKVLDRLIRLNLNRNQQHPRETLEVLQHAVEKLMLSQPLYQCEKCGFSVKKMHWRCPSCKHWSSIKPVQGLACQPNK